MRFIIRLKIKYLTGRLQKVFNKLSENINQNNKFPGIDNNDS